jgi:curved DNA binding protein
MQPEVSAGGWCDWPWSRFLACFPPRSAARSRLPLNRNPEKKKKESVYGMKKQELKKKVEEEDEEEEVEEEGEAEEDEEAANDLRNNKVVSKYKEAADVANRALARVVAECQAGRRIAELCALGDKFISDEVAKLYTKAVDSRGKPIDKGVAFPTCISVNNCVGHFSPLPSATGEGAAVLQEGDMVKIDLGVQLDGYVATQAGTLVIGNAEGRKADVLNAAYTAAEAALRLLKPGRTNREVTDAIQRSAEAFGCQPMQGVLSHQMKRYVIDGSRVIINRETPDQKVDEVTFEAGEVWQVDIVMSTGEGRAKEGETRTTVYKRDPETSYLLKMRAARATLNQITQRFAFFPFTLRALDEKSARLGLTELAKHSLVVPYPVLYEKPGEFVAQIKFTALILTSQTERITRLPPALALPPPTQRRIEDDKLKQILALGLKHLSEAQKAKKKKKKKKKKPADAATTAAAPKPSPLPPEQPQPQSPTV